LEASFFASVQHDFGSAIPIPQMILNVPGINLLHSLFAICLSIQLILTILYVNRSQKFVISCFAISILEVQILKTLVFSRILHFGQKLKQFLPAIFILEPLQRHGEVLHFAIGLLLLLVILKHLMRPLGFVWLTFGVFL